MTGLQLHPPVLTRNNVCNYRFQPRNEVTAGFTISSRFFFFFSLSPVETGEDLLIAV